MKRREAKSKGEKGRYKHLNAEFQRIARRDKKAFLSHQCKEIDILFLTNILTFWGKFISNYFHLWGCTESDMTEATQQQQQVV